MTNQPKWVKPFEKYLGLDLIETESFGSMCVYNVVSPTGVVLFQVGGHTEDRKIGLVTGAQFCNWEKAPDGWLPNVPLYSRSVPRYP